METLKKMLQTTNQMKIVNESCVCFFFKVWLNMILWLEIYQVENLDLQFGNGSKPSTPG
jgi:hypothetical protein